MVGDAILAGVACGVFQSIADGVHSMVRIKHSIQPGKDVEVYEHAYQRYCDLDKTLFDYFKRNYSKS